MDQAEFWSRCEEHFRRCITAENERLVIGWEASDDDVWLFEGPPNSAGVFKELATVAGYGLTRESGPSAWKDWLDALRRNGYESRVPQTNKTLVDGQKPQARGLLAAAGSRKLGVLAQAAERAKLSLGAFAGVINTPFSSSALLCLKLALDASTQLNEPDQGIDWEWARSLVDSSIDLGEPESDAVDVQDTTQRARPGPKTDTETAQRVFEIVTQIAGSEALTSKLDDVCEGS